MFSVVAFYSCGLRRRMMSRSKWLPLKSIIVASPFEYSAHAYAIRAGFHTLRQSQKSSISCECRICCWRLCHSRSATLSRICAARIYLNHWLISPATEPLWNAQSCSRRAYELILAARPAP